MSPLSKSIEQAITDILLKIKIKNFLIFHKFQSTFHYDSQFWSNRISYNLPGSKTGFDSQETKLPTYWNTSFSKICLGMKIDNQLRFIVINKQANSLYSLIADGQYRHTTLGPGTWKTLVGSQASLQPHCDKEGFNAVGDNTYQSKARIGITANQQNDCPPVIPELVLAQEVDMMIPTRVEMRQRARQIMETSTSKPWGTFWYSDKGHN